MGLRIIINADDFGRDDDTVAATVDAFARGALTGATIMPAMPATAAAVAFARAHPQFSFGAHLTFVREDETTAEAPVSPPADVADLISPDGRFRPSNEVRRMALLGRISVDQIAREAQAQILRLRDELRVPISHVDSHGHLHKFKPFREALGRVLPGLGIERVRTVQDLYLVRPLRSPTYWYGGRWAAKLRRLFRTTDHLYMPGATDAAWAARLWDRLGDGTLEVGVHPGRAETWRAAELAGAAAFADEARRRGIPLIGWKDV